MPSSPSDTAYREWSNRRFGALLAALLWLLGFELVPNVHVGFHDLFGHHHHGAQARHEHHEATHAGRAESEHTESRDAEPEHEHPAKADSDRPPTADPPGTATVGNPEHGQHALAHRGIAAIDPPSPQPRVLTAPARLSPEPPPTTEPLRLRRPETLRSRGPPLA